MKKMVAADKNPKMVHSDILFACYDLPESSPENRIGDRSF